MADGAGRLARHAVYDGHLLSLLFRDVDVGKVFRTTHVLAGLPVPHGQEDALQVAHGIAVDAHMYVVPGTYLGQSRDVVVGHVHAARVARPSVDDHNLAVVAVQGMVDVGESDGVELHQLDASGADGLDMLFFQRLAVRPVAEGVKQGTYFHAFLHLLGQQVEQGVGDGVVAEVEVFQVYMMACPADGVEQVGKFIPSRSKQFHAVVARHGDACRAQVVHHQRVARCLGACGSHGEEDAQQDNQYSVLQNYLCLISFRGGKGSIKKRNLVQSGATCSVFLSFKPMRLFFCKPGTAVLRQL